LSRAFAGVQVFYSLRGFLEAGTLLLLTDRPDEPLPHLLQRPRQQGEGDGEGEGGMTMAERVFEGLRHMHDKAGPEVQWLMVRCPLAMSPVVVLHSMYRNFVTSPCLLVWSRRLPASRRSVLPVESLPPPMRLTAYGFSCNLPQVVDDDTFIFPDALLSALARYSPRVGTERLYVGNFNENNKGDKFFFPFGGAGLLVNRRLMDYLLTEGPKPDEGASEGGAGEGKGGSWWDACLKAQRHHPGDFALYLCLKETVGAGERGFDYDKVFVQDKAFNQFDIRELAIHFFEGVLPSYPPATLHHLEDLTYFSVTREKARERLGQLAAAAPFYLRFRPFVGLSDDGKWAVVMYFGYSLRVYPAKDFSPDEVVKHVSGG
jgi:hypothetical protein